MFAPPPEHKDLFKELHLHAFQPLGDQAHVEVSPRRQMFHCFFGEDGLGHAALGVGGFEDEAVIDFLNHHTPGIKGCLEEILVEDIQLPQNRFRARAVLQFLGPSFGCGLSVLNPQSVKIPLSKSLFEDEVVLCKRQSLLLARKSSESHQTLKILLQASGKTSVTMPHLA